MKIKPAVIRRPNGLYYDATTGVLREWNEYSQGELIEIANKAPDNALTFSHEVNRWLLGWHGLWVVCSPESARMAFDSGAVFLDAIVVEKKTHHIVHATALAWGVQA